MGKNKIAPNTAAETDLGVRDLTAEDADRLAIREAELIRRYGDGDPYDRSRLEGEARAYMLNSCMNMFEAGKRLALLKAKEERGQFDKCLERIGVKRRTAYMMINAADKFLDDQGRSKLDVSGKVQSIALLGMTKIYELATLDVEDIDKLVEGGEAAGITLEEAERLSTRQLRQKLRERDAEIKQIRDQAGSESEVHNQILAEKNEKIDDLDRQLRSAGDPARWHKGAEEMLMRLHSFSPQYSRIVGEFAKLVDEINGMTVGEWEQSQIILLEHARYTLEMFGNSLDGLGRQLDMSAPQGNAVFHSLTAFGVVPNSPPAEPEVEDV